MRILSLETLAAAGGLAVLLSSPAFSQAAGAAGNATTSPASVTAGGDAVAEITAESVDPAKPFGELDVTAAGATGDEIKTFFNGLTPEQQTELQQRCGVIMDPVHQERYAEETATTLCRNLDTAGLSN